MDNLAKLFILDEKGDEIGRLVLDMDKLMNLWQSMKGEESADDLHVPTSTDDEVIEVSCNDISIRRKSDGTLYLVVNRKKEDE